MQTKAIGVVREHANSQRVVVVASDHHTGDQQRVFIVKLTRDVLKDVLARAHAVTSVNEASLVARVVREVSGPSAATAATSSEPGISESRRSMLGRAKEFIDEHLEDAELSPEKVAAGIFVSRRYLYLLFEHEARSVSRHIIVRRLQVVAQRLVDARSSHQSVADIAMRVGFKDASHFARAFKSEYGVTPGQFRAEGRMSGAA